MPARQLHLFAPPKPLVQRLGEAFFRAAPREPGVYGAFKSHGRRGTNRPRLTTFRPNY